MTRRVKEFVDIRDHSSLDELIHKLIELRDSLPENSDAELRLRGDDVFGRRITITYLRDQTAEEAETRTALHRGRASGQGEGTRAAAAGAWGGVLFGARQARETAHRRLNVRPARKLSARPFDTITQAGRLRPVVKDVPEMAAATRAQLLGAEQQALQAARRRSRAAGRRRSLASRCRCRTWSSTKTTGWRRPAQTKVPRRCSLSSGLVNCRSVPASRRI